MSLMTTLRKGLKFLLMSFGVSSPQKKPASQGKPQAPTNKEMGS